MRMKYQMIVAFVFVLAGFAGIVNAEPCPSPDQWDTVNQLSPAGPVTGIFTVVSDSNNPATYSVQGTSPILEVCGASSSSNALVVNPSFWNSPPSGKKSNGWSNYWFQFSGASNPISPGIVTSVGTVTWSTPDPQGNEIYLLHISNSNCPGSSTCFVKPGTSDPPIPELNPAILTATGLFGLVLLSRRCKKT